MTGLLFERPLRPPIALQWRGGSSDKAAAIDAAADAAATQQALRTRPARWRLLRGDNCETVHWRRLKGRLNRLLRLAERSGGSG